MSRTNLTQIKIQEINSLLGFDIESYQDELRGVNDTKYILKTNDEGSFKNAMLTIYEPQDINAGGRSEGEIIKSTEYGYHLHKSLKEIKDVNGNYVNVGVPKPYLFSNDKPYYQMDFVGVTKIISLHELVFDYQDKLNNIHDYGEDSIDEDICKKVGKALASIQLAGQDFTQRIENKYPIESFEDMLAEIHSKIDDNIVRIDPVTKNPTEVLDWIEKKVEEIIHHYKKIKGDLEFGTCHLDCHPVNVILASDKTYFLDFGTVGIDSYVYDMTMGLDTFVCRNNNPIDALVKTFMHGYLSVRLMKDIEVENILFFIKAGLVKWAMYRILKCFDNHESTNIFIARDNIERYENWEKYLNQYKLLKLFPNSQIIK